jgi:hypothetical protein
LWKQLFETRQSARPSFSKTTFPIPPNAHF